MQKNISKTLHNFLIISLGNLIYTVAVAFFILPNNLITGGTTGLALFGQYMFHIPITAFVYVFNIAMFLLGAWVLGKAFALTTILSTFEYPFFLSILQLLSSRVGPLTDDMMLATLFAGAGIGIGLGLVIQAGASTGGMDIPPIILNKLFGLSIPVMIYVGDTALLLIQALYSSTEQVLYGILVVLLTSIVMDKILIMGQKQTQVMVVSPKYEEINQMIHQKIDRGSTLIHAMTGLKKTEQPVVMTVISNRQLSVLNDLILQIDPQAFVVASEINEVKGRGFTLSKQAIKDVK